MKRLKIIADPNCPPGMVYIADPKLVQTISAKGKVTKPLEQLAAKINLRKPRPYRPTQKEIDAAADVYIKYELDGVEVWMRKALIAAHKARKP